MFGFARRAHSVNLALQGGGAHGAFTWGVIDRLLEEHRLEIGWVSGTSAGAINAAALAAGLATGGKAAARAKLRAVWESVQEAGVSDLLKLNPFLNSLVRSPSMGQIGAALFSPYEFNPLGFDPLRKLLETHIDFAAVRAFEGIELLIAATDVATARKRLFRRDEITVEAVLASACLPMLHHAVEIDGRAYWDGGFSANPDLVTLVAESPIGDTLLVALNPVEKSGIPRTSRDISADVSRVSFSQPLLRDIAEIDAAAHAQRETMRWRPARSRSGRMAAHRMHLIEAGRHILELSPDTKLRPDRAIVVALFAAGREEADRWLTRHRADIGRRSSVDLAGHFLGPLGPLSERPRRAPAQSESDATAIAEKL